MSCPLLLRILPSDALSQTQLNRGMSGSVTQDTGAIFRLSGFDNALTQIGNDDNVNKTYLQVGSLTNLTIRTMTIHITIRPDFSQLPANDRVCELGVQFDALPPKLFTRTDPAPQQVVLTLVPGQTSIVKASLTRNKKVKIPTQYDFLANDRQGMLLVHIPHTPSSPRQMIFK
jgi:hypothetical protein